MTEAEAFRFVAATHEAGHAIVAAALGFTNILARIDPRPLTTWKPGPGDEPLRLVAACAGDEAVKLFVPSDVFWLAGGPQPVNQWECDDAMQWRLMRQLMPNATRSEIEPFIERAANQARKICLQNHHILKTAVAELIAGDLVTDARLAFTVRPWKPEAVADPAPAISFSATPGDPHGMQLR